MTEQGIINRVAQSALVTLNLEDFYHSGERVVYDLKVNLFKEVILKEKDFRSFIKSNDWSEYKDKNVAIICSVDAVVPVWAFMLLVTKIEPFANLVIEGDIDELDLALFNQAFNHVNFADYQDKKVVIKGCGELPIKNSAYVEATRRLLPYASSIMYGEPCSTVPIYKKGKVQQ